MDYDDMKDNVKKPFYGKCKAKKSIGTTYWRMEKCMIKMGNFCELTGEYHWKSMVSCHSCDNCGTGGHKYSPRY